MTNSADDRSGITQLVHGNQNDARELRANLAVFARQVDSPALRRLVSDVLSGRRDVREVFRTKEFNDVLGARLERIERGIAQLTDEERAAVFDRSRPLTPQSTLDAMRDGDSAAPSSSEPGPDDEFGGPLLRRR
jgi:hypothetical protein